MTHPKQHAKTIVRLILPTFILLLGMSNLKATEYASLAEPEEVPSYILEGMEPETTVLGLFGDKKKKRKKGDPFAKKCKKKPNITCSRPPRTKSRSKLYMHAMSRKKVKNSKQSAFSNSKPRYNLFKANKKKKKDNKKENRGRQKTSQP